MMKRLFWKITEPKRPEKRIIASTLISAFFAFTTVELWSLAGIKKKKIEREYEE